MTADENVFFREATLRICSSLDIEEALTSFFEYVRSQIPATRMYLHVHDVDLNLSHLVASASVGPNEKPGQIVYFPETGRLERAADVKGGLLVNEEVIRVINQPELEVGMPDILKGLGLGPKSSLMNMQLKLVKGNLIGSLAVFADGLDQYTSEHVRLLKLIHRPLAIAMSNALKHEEVMRLKDLLVDDNRQLYADLRSASGDEIIGADFGLKAVMTLVRQVAPLDSPALLLGETGTGKEVIANAIHYSSPRKDGPFIKVNCGAIPEPLLDSELFGHERGAFTGAVSQKRGRFERADKGTIFLDEIGELPPQAQVRLLRVLQEKEIERVGGTYPISVDIRVISATNRNLQDMVAAGRFREDLWFRLNVFPIMIPPLRQRREDIPALVHHFINRKSRELKIPHRTELVPGAMEKLLAYHWPGNVRELANLIERALIQNRSGALSFETLPAAHTQADHEVPRKSGPNPNVLSLQEINSRHIRQALEMAGGKINGPGGAAQILGLNPSTLRARMKKLGIPYGWNSRRRSSAGSS